MDLERGDRVYVSAEGSAFFGEHGTVQSVELPIRKAGARPFYLVVFDAVGHSPYSFDGLSLTKLDAVTALAHLAPKHGLGRVDDPPG